MAVSQQIALSPLFPSQGADVAPSIPESRYGTPLTRTQRTSRDCTRACIVLGIAWFPSPRTTSVHTGSRSRRSRLIFPPPENEFSNLPISPEDVSVVVPQRSHHPRFFCEVVVFLDHMPPFTHDVYFVTQKGPPDCSESPIRYGVRLHLTDLRGSSPVEVLFVASWRVPSPKRVLCAPLAQCWAQASPSDACPSLYSGAHLRRLRASRLEGLLSRCAACALEEQLKRAAISSLAIALKSTFCQMNCARG